MIFRLHEVFMLEILALVASSFLIMLGSKQDCCKYFYKLIGFLGVLVSLLAFSCTTYHGYQFAKSGMLQMHDPMMMNMGMGMMGNMPHKPETTPAEHGCMP